MPTQVDIRHFFSGRGPWITRIDTDLFWGAQAASLLSQSGSDFRQVTETIFSESNFAFGDFFARKLSSSSGGKGIRTPDFQLAKLALYQLSYAPARMEDGRWKM